MYTLNLRSSSREEFVDITDEVESVLSGSGVVTVFVSHTTAGVCVNEGFDPDVQVDVIKKLKELFPRDGAYLHAEGNSDSHLKSIVVGCSVQVPFHEGKLLLGRWQRIFFCEFDGPRSREVLVTF
ncbi:MAG: secondary thiamine-phosphate synthase enzyme YjbQ [Candidatus Woesearchaeota archaeon]